MRRDFVDFVDDLMMNNFLSELFERECEICSLINI